MLRELVLYIKNVYHIEPFGEMNNMPFDSYLLFEHKMVYIVLFISHI